MTEQDEIEAMLADLTQAARDVLVERGRQQQVEGWTPEHDDKHVGGEMALAAACYAASTASDPKFMSPPPVERLLLNYWPWNRKWWKPKDRRRDLVRSGALILAELERLDRAAQAKKCTCHPDDNPPKPCAGKFAYSECVGAAQAASGETWAAAAANTAGHKHDHLIEAIPAYRYRRLTGCF